MKSPSLLELERWMKSQIDRKSIKSGNREALRDTVPLNFQGGDPGENRLSVYEGGYIARTREAIKEVYEALCHVLGPRQTFELVEAYASEYPSENYNLSFFGRHLPEFLLKYPLTQDLPFLPDLAKLEWQVCNAFHAEEQSPMNPQTLAGLSEEAWDRITLQFQPSVSLISSEWPVLDIWESRKTSVPEIKIDLVGRPQNVLIFRQGLRVYAESIAKKEFQILEGLLAGQSLGAISGELIEDDEEYLPISDWFSRWMNLGLITGFKI